DISFEPKEGLAAGSFELERTKSRDPGERPRNSAVSIEAGFVPPSEPEPDYVEEVDEEEEFVDGSPEDSDEEDGEERAAPPQGERRERDDGGRGERDGGRKRRRRGGRGRNRDRDGPRPSGADTGIAAAAPAPGLETASAEDGEFEPALPGAPLGENGEPRRKRRRRRGRRGGRDREGGPAEAPQTGFVPVVDRFGPVPDEIDTTPSEGRHAPGAPSAPVWSLKDDIPDTTPSDDAGKPSKKGWWQRTFSGE
ncbi:MAG TPA: hypothetical protein VNY75_06430, partial [Rhizomicrobium sp.]|nr:hypothetical protein [Rhizomicrobium sp.]